MGETRLKSVEDLGCFVSGVPQHRSQRLHLQAEHGILIVNVMLLILLLLCYVEGRGEAWLGHDSTPAPRPRRAYSVVPPTGPS